MGKAKAKLVSLRRFYYASAMYFGTQMCALLHPNSLSETKFAPTALKIHAFRFLEANSSLAESWIRENASPELKLRLQTCCLVPSRTSTTSLQQHEDGGLNRGKRNSITSDLFQSWLQSNSPVKRSTRSSSRFASFFN